MCSGPSAYECGCAAGSAPHQGADDGWTTSDSHSWLGRGQTLAQQAQAMYVWSQGQVDDSCAAAEGRWGAWRCYLGQYAAPHIQATTLVLQSQIDEWQGFWNGFFNYTKDATAFEYATWFRATTSKQLQHSAVAGDDMHIFSPNCYHHGLAYDARFWELKVTQGAAPAWSGATMLGSLLGGKPTPHAVVDACDGLPCSPATGPGYASECSPISPPSPPAA